MSSGLGRLLASAKHKLSLPHGSGDLERAAGSAGGVHMARTTSAEEAQGGLKGALPEPGCGTTWSACFARCGRQARLSILALCPARPVTACRRCRGGRLCGGAAPGAAPGADGRAGCQRPLVHPAGLLRQPARRPGGGPAGPLRWVGGWVGGRVCASPPACLCQLVGRHHVLHGPLRALQRCGANLMVGDSFSALSACRLRQDDAAEQHCGLSHGPGQRRGADWQRGGGRPQVGGQAGGRAGGWVGGSQLLQSWVCGMRPQNTRCLPISSNALPPSLLAPSPASAAGGATPRSPTCPRATCSCPP